MEKNGASLVIVTKETRARIVTRARNSSFILRFISQLNATTFSKQAIAHAVSSALSRMSTVSVRKPMQNNLNNIHFPSKLSILTIIFFCFLHKFIGLRSFFSFANRRASSTKRHGSVVRLWNKSGRYFKQRFTTG